jgi:hypothetical protein
MTSILADRRRRLLAAQHLGLADLGGEVQWSHPRSEAAFPAAWLGTVDEAEIERLLGAWPHGWPSRSSPPAAPTTWAH